MRKVEEKQIEKKGEFTLEEAFTVWKNEAKSGNHYLKGYDLNGNKLVGYFNGKKKNPNEPDVRFYELDKEGKQGKEVASLWENEAKNGNRYLSGKTTENEKLVAFYQKDEDEKKPFIKAYFSEEK